MAFDWSSLRHFCHKNVYIYLTIIASHRPIIGPRQSGVTNGAIPESRHFVGISVGSSGPTSSYVAPVPAVGWVGYQAALVGVPALR